MKTADGGGGGGGEGRTAAEAETTRTPTGIQNTFQPVDTLVVLKTLSQGPDVRHVHLPTRPSQRRPAGDLFRVSRAGRWAGGLGGATADTGSVNDTGRPRGRGTPSDSRFQRYGWAAGRSSASRVPLSSNATTTSHGLYKLEIVVIVDLRMLAMYFYFLINHIELS